MPALQPSFCQPDDGSRIVLADSSQHFHRGDVHVIANEWRANPFLAAEPWDHARRGLGLAARKDLDGRAALIG